MSIENNTGIPRDTIYDTHQIQADGKPTQALPQSTRDTKSFVRPIDPDRHDSVALVDAAAIREALGLSQPSLDRNASQPISDSSNMDKPVGHSANPEQFARMFSADMLQAGSELRATTERFLKQKTYPFGIGKKTKERMVEKMLDLCATVLFEASKEAGFQLDMTTAKRKEVLHTIFVRDIGTADLWNDKRIQDFVGTYIDDIFNLAIAKKGV